ncbi:hypothetical protein [Flavobacterium johnsoniae]|nr:hypothetical protein [Flavobacterium johnsoniae]WQG82373.1 hypothetical protein SR927_04485 [Flavobacterium johnsoniae UW101]
MVPFYGLNKSAKCNLKKMTKMTLRLNYSTYFNQNDTIEDLLAPLGKMDLLRAVSYLINRTKSEKNAVDTISNWFNDKNIQAQLIPKTKSNTSILNIISSLNLLTYITEKADTNTEEIISPNDFELRLFKSYLLLNSEQDKIEVAGQKNLPIDGSEEKLSASLITLLYHDYDLQNYILQEVFLVQLIKSIDFFQFIEKDNKLKNHLSLFLSKYNCKTWTEWIMNLLNLILPILDHNDETYSEFRLDRDENFDTSTTFLSLFTIPLEYEELPDFIHLRSNPILKINDETFIIINKLFLVERIFKSLVFEFSLKINKEVKEEYQLKDFRATYCDNFSEQTLLYNALYNCFPNNPKWSKIKGEDFKKMKYSSEPDYYVRFKNKVLIFESKDVILKGNEKHSRDYSILSKCLKEKFLKIEKNNNISKKAILQIIENIRRVLDKYYDKIDTNYKTEFLNFYPILVVHDRQFDTPELNRLINIWFKKELEKAFNKSEQFKINELVIINIDTLILYQEHFKKRGIYGLEIMINKYFEFKKPRICKNQKELEQKYLETSISFSDFIAKEFNKTNFKKVPSFVNEYINKLI